MQMEFGKAPNMGFAVELSVPITKGEIEANNQKQEGNALILGGKLMFTGLAEIGTTLKMTGKWRRAFGVSFLTIADIEVGYVSKYAMFQQLVSILRNFVFDWILLQLWYQTTNAVSLKAKSTSFLNQAGTYLQFP